MNIKALGANIRMATVGALSTVFPSYFAALGAQAFLRPRTNNSTRHWESEFDGFKRSDICVEGKEYLFGLKGLVQWSCLSMDGSEITSRWEVLWDHYSALATQ